MSLSLILYGTADRKNKSIEEWLYLNYSRAQEIAKIELLKEDRDYLLNGRFSDDRRNIRRTLENISVFYGEVDGPLRKAWDLKDPVGIWFPMMCFQMLVMEVKDAAYGEYYYRYEKRYD